MGMQASSLGGRKREKEEGKRQGTRARRRAWPTGTFRDPVDNSGGVECSTISEAHRTVYISWEGLRNLEMRRRVRGIHVTLTRMHTPPPPTPSLPIRCLHHVHRLWEVGGEG